MLRSYREFFRVYMNDIIVFSKILTNHLKHFKQIFQLFVNKCVNLTFIKFFLNYLFIMLFDQRVNNLKLFISIEKIAIIISLQFSKSF